MHDMECQNQGFYRQEIAWTNLSNSILGAAEVVMWRMSLAKALMLYTVSVLRVRVSIECFPSNLPRISYWRV